MGITVLKMELANPAKPKNWVVLEFLVDSGAVYSVVPAHVLRKLGIRSFAREEFRLADGSAIIRKKGTARFRHGKRVGSSDVIFGEKGDSVLLGALTLEALGLSPQRLSATS